MIIFWGEMIPIGRLTQQTDLSEDSGHPPHHPSKGRGRGEALQRDKLKTGLKYMATRTSDPLIFKARIFWKTYLSLGQTISAHGNRRWRVLKYFVPRAFGVLCQSSAQNENESKWSITFSWDSHHERQDWRFVAHFWVRPQLLQLFANPIISLGYSTACGRGWDEIRQKRWGLGWEWGHW